MSATGDAVGETLSLLSGWLWFVFCHSSFFYFRFLFCFLHSLADSEGASFVLDSEGDTKVNHVGSLFQQLLPSFPPGLRGLGCLAAWFALDWCSWGEWSQDLGVPVLKWGQPWTNRGELVTLAPYLITLSCLMIELVTECWLRQPTLDPWPSIFRTFPRGRNPWSAQGSGC